MKRHSTFLMCSALILSMMAFSTTHSFAQKTAKACDDEWAANKAAIQKSGKTKKAYVAECRAAKPAAATPAATPAPAPAAAAKPAAAPAATPAAKPVATTKPVDGRQAEYARERACGVDWKADKAAGKTAGLTWPKYWSECNKRKKAMGM